MEVRYWDEEAIRLLQESRQVGLVACTRELREVVEAETFGVHFGNDVCGVCEDQIWDEKKKWLQDNGNLLDWWS